MPPAPATRLSLNGTICKSIPQLSRARPYWTILRSASQVSQHSPSRTQRPSIPHRPSPSPLPSNPSQKPSVPSRWSSSTTSATSGNFTYKLAAAYSGKANTFNPSTHHFSFSPTDNKRYRSGSPIAEVIPEAGKLASGQDAVFITTVGRPSSSSTARICAFGVADGVGGYSDQGIDSAAFAHGLCMYMEEAAKYHDPSSTSSSSASSQSPANSYLTPSTLLDTGYSRVCSDRSILGGGSTACVLLASPSGTLSSANLGDSGYIILRRRRIAFASEPQTHAFNTPYQLSTIPPDVLKQMREFGGGSPFHDLPSKADTEKHRLEHGDVVLVATDGVWDNVSQQELLKIVGEELEKAGVWSAASSEEGVKVSEKLGEVVEERDVEGKWSLQTKLATEVVRIAKSHGLNQRRDGPFARAVHKEYPGERYHGGKPDDIAVVVAIAVDERRVQAQHGGNKL